MKKTSNIKPWIVLSTCFLFLVVCVTYYIQSRENPSSSSHSVTLTNVGFDTPIILEAKCTEKEFDQYASIVQDTFTYYNKLFDQYNQYDGVNNIYTLNQNKTNEYIKLDSEIINCINLAKEIYDLSNKFDITQGAVLSIWHDVREESIKLNDDGKDGILPDKDELKRASKHTGFDKLEIKDDSIRFLDENLKLDLGGIGKGYAAQRCKEKLNEAGLDNGYINAGGNVVLLGDKKDAWRIGIQDPSSNSSIVRLEIEKAKSIVTSGDYQRYYMIGDTRYSHIIDPDTLYPATYTRSVTVITDDSAFADGISTTLFNMSYEDGEKFIKELQEKYNIEVIWLLDKSQDIQSDIENDNYIIKTTDNIRNKVELSSKISISK